MFLGNFRNLFSKEFAVGSFKRSPLLSTLLQFTGLFLVCSAVGCGGGTTGTSPTDSLKFSGVAEQADGARAGSLTMSVRSGSTDEPLVDSGTDATGQFDMELPSDERALIVDVSGVGSAGVTRSQVGAGAMSAKLKVTSQGALSIPEFFEAQVVSSCDSILVSGTRLVISGEVGEEPCLIKIVTASEGLNARNFRGRVVATCAGAATSVISTNASSDGEITLDLNEAFSKRCVDVSVVISTPDSVGLESVFTVE